MSKPLIRIHNIETDEVLDREMTDAEFLEYEADQKLEATKRAEEESKQTIRLAVLDKLGLTAEEAQALLS